MLRRLIALFAAFALALLTACSGNPQGPSDPPETTEPASDAIRMAAVGDSITDADSPDLDGGTPGPQSWVSYAVGQEIDFVGGWAVWGASTSEMASGVEEMDADVLVILAGTNDASSMAHEQIGENLIAIERAAGVDQVVLSSVPPIDAAPSNATELNAYLEAFAAQHGWMWTDAAQGLRDGDEFADGMAYDGLHPTEEGAQVLGEAIGRAVLRAAQ